MLSYLIYMIKKESEYIKILKKASNDYYNEQPSMSDEEFDKIYDEFKKLYPKSKYFKTVGSEVSSNIKKVKHEILMGSLLKINNIEELNFWFNKYAEKNEIVWSEKVDGLSISLYYENGIFKQAVTRGDGSVGEDVTENIKKSNLLKKLRNNYTGFIRGEVFLTKKNFDKYFSDKINPRNAASGTLRRLDGERSEYLDIVCYWLNESFKNEKDRLDKIKSLGLQTPKYGLCKDLESIQKVWKNYEDGKRDSSDYEIDGICLYINSVKIQEELGIIDNRPRYARAYKFSPKEAITTLESVEWQVGRTGRITPVAKVIPVNVAGALITKVSLHNIAEIKRKNIKINSVVHIERKGDVIPQITKSVGGTKDIKLINKCPSCRSELVRDEIFLSCLNKECPKQNILSLLFWLKTLDIKGFGDKMVEKLFMTGKVLKIEDFYSLTEKDISSLERSGEVLSKKLIEELNSKRTIDPEIFIKGLGINGFGEGDSKLVLNKYSFNQLLDLDYESLLEIDGIGEETAKKAIEGLKDKKNEIRSLLKFITLKEKVDGKLSGKSYCFSGFRDKNLENKIKENGGTVTDSFNKNLSALIVKSEQESSSKIEKAKKNNIKIIELSKVDSIFD